jgi:stage V sporulation protein AD
MGAAMAPAAADVIATHFRDLSLPHDHYDAIITGDLGFYGSQLLHELLKSDNIDIAPLHNDCGLLIFDREKQDVHAGGSGCGCCGAVFASYLLKQLQDNKIKKLLFVPTGALHSVVAIQQGETIPAIAHAVAIENEV